MGALKIENCYDANFVVNGGTEVCRYDKPQCHSGDKVAVMATPHLAPTPTPLSFYLSICLWVAGCVCLCVRCNPRIQNKYMGI